MTKALGICGLTLCLLTTCPSAVYSATEELHGRIAELAVRPLRFVLYAGSDSYRVRTATATKLVRDGKELVAEMLRDADYVWVVGEKGKDDRGRATFSAVKIDVATVLSGRIQSIQEVLPLRLVVSDRTSKRTVHFSESTVLTRRGKKLDPDELRRGQHVWIAGLRRGDVLVAKNVEAIDMLEGEIMGIMEIFPLRLSVKTKTGEVAIQLQEDTFVTKKSHRIDPGQLRERDVIRVIGSQFEDHFIAKEIVVEDVGKK